MRVVECLPAAAFAIILLYQASDPSGITSFRLGHRPVSVERLRTRPNVAARRPSSLARRTGMCVTRAKDFKGFGDEPKPKKKSMSQEEIEEAMAEMEERKRAQAPQVVESSTQRTAAAELVSTRILYRIIGFAGIPFFSGILLLPFFYFLKTAKGIEIPLAAVYASQGVFIGAALFGITYGALSASWDPMREGSAFGFEEFQTNFPVIWQRIRRGEQ
ncbi:hypothetical protein AAMO2058_000862400 [Amorphochlora amoebiformis]|mmetsp:Transcript_15538/g.24621  ORF Transcript_15538/g.24621 Transcript_15538/m.24621 type:complete len:217 (-) Transcript_15538:88-738(-)